MLKAKGAMALAEGLVYNYSLLNLTLERDPIPIRLLKGEEVVGTMDLTNRGFGPLSGVVIAKLLEVFNPEVDKLVLDRNPLAEGVASIAEFMRSNRYMKELHLDCVGMNAQLTAKLAEALQQNTTLKKLHMLMNTAGQTGAKAIEEMLGHNTSITFVDIRDNRLPPASKEALSALAAGRNLEIRV